MIYSGPQVPTIRGSFITITRLSHFPFSWWPVSAVHGWLYPPYLPVVRGPSPSQPSAAAPDTCYYRHLVSPASNILQLPPGESPTCGAEQLQSSRHLFRSCDVGELYPKQFAGLLVSETWWPLQPTHYTRSTHLATCRAQATAPPLTPAPPRPWFPVCAVTGVTGLAAAAACCLHSQF